MKTRNTKLAWAVAVTGCVLTCGARAAEQSKEYEELKLQLPVAKAMPTPKQIKNPWIEPPPNPDYSESP
jgi:hypothetical protein